MTVAGPVEAGVRLLRDRYELQSLIAVGGMGQVWRGRDTLLNRRVAVKVLQGGLAADRTFLARFRVEAQHAASLSHPSIATVYDYGEDVLQGSGEPVAFLVMELVDGESLAQLLERSGRLAVGTTLSIVSQVASALGVAHAAGVIHRDVKPGNILVAPEGVAKITDFGIAWSASSVPLTGEGQLLGTAQYLSPEQAQGAGVSAASDVYALGLVGYECLAGRRAVEGDSPLQIAMRQITQQPFPLPPDVPGPVRAVIERAIAKNPAQRFADGAALAGAVHGLLADGLLGDGMRSGGVVSDGVAIDGVLGDGSERPAAPVPLGLPATGLPVSTRTRTARVVAATGDPAVEPTAEPTAPVVGASGARGPHAPGRRRNAGVVAAVAVVLLALLGAVVAGVGLRRPAPVPAASSPGPAAAAATAPASGAAPVVRPEELVGKPVSEVEARLAALGLRPQLVAVVTDAVPSGLVTEVTPTGELTPGREVTVTYAEAPSTGATGGAPESSTTAPVGAASSEGAGPGGRGAGVGGGGAASGAPAATARGGAPGAGAGGTGSAVRPPASAGGGQGAAPVAPATGGGSLGGTTPPTSASTSSRTGSAPTSQSPATTSTRSTSGSTSGSTGAKP